MRLPSFKSKYVCVGYDGSVRELSAYEQEDLRKTYDPEDGNRPYEKVNYWQLTPDNKIDGYIKRIKVPWWIPIKPYPQNGIDSYRNKSDE